MPSCIAHLEWYPWIPPKVFDQCFRYGITYMDNTPLHVVILYWSTSCNTHEIILLKISQTKSWKDSKCNIWIGYLFKSFIIVKSWMMFWIPCRTMQSRMMCHFRSSLCIWSLYVTHPQALWWTQLRVQRWRQRKEN
jgi:hypothetical protein